MPGWVNTADPLILVIVPATAKPIVIFSSVTKEETKKMAAFVSLMTQNSCINDSCQHAVSGPIKKVQHLRAGWLKRRMEKWPQRR